MIDETAYWVALSRVAGIGPVRTRALLDFFGSAEEAWLASGANLQMAGLDTRTADNLLLLRRSLDLDKEMARLEQAGVHALTWESEEYPERLKEAPGSPAVLYIMGELTESDRWAVGVVGTRRSTPYGREVTERLSTDLAQA